MSGEGLKGMILIVFLLLISLHGAAQNQFEAPIITSDSTITNNVEWGTLENRIPTEEQISKYQKDSRFDYEKGPSLFTQILQFIQSIWAKLYDSGREAASGWGGFVRVLLYILAGLFVVGVIVLIILKLKGVKLRSLLGKKKVDAPDIDIYSEDVNVMDFSTLISSALKNKNYRLATRFLYLRNLKTMSDNEIIVWSAHKTNISYQYEIKDYDLRAGFMEVTYIFDYIWYGEFPIDKALYEDVENRMSNFNKRVSR